jgi:hypothetical protein
VLRVRLAKIKGSPTKAIQVRLLAQEVWAPFGQLEPSRSNSRHQRMQAGGERRRSDSEALQLIQMQDAESGTLHEGGSGNRGMEEAADCLAGSKHALVGADASQLAQQNTGRGAGA